MPTRAIIHESVAGVLKGIGHKHLRATAIQPANHRALIREHDSDAILETVSETDGKIVVEMASHPRLSNVSWESKTIAKGKAKALELCTKAGGFPIFEATQDGVVGVRFTKDKTKATATDAASLAAHLKLVKEEDETDGTGEPSGDTKTDSQNTNTMVGTKKGTMVDNLHPSQENSKECNEGKNGKDKNGKPIKPVNEEATGNNASAEKGDKRKFTEYPELLVKRDKLAAKKDKTDAEKTEEAELTKALDLISESFYNALPHGVTFVLYPEGKMEVHGINEDELAPFGGTAPAMPVRYAEKAKGDGPNSKVDMGVLSLYPKENWNTQGKTILAGKDFKAHGWGTPGKGTGKQGKWSDTGKNAIDSKKDLKAGTEK